MLKTFSLELRVRQKCPSQLDRQDKENKCKNMNTRIKTTPTDNLVMYIDYPKESTDKWLNLISEFS